MLIGNGFELLQNAKVAVFGAGGVGGFVIESLARSGVGALDIIDGDTVASSNLNRQIIADTDSIGKNKAEVFAGRIEKIAPDCKVRAFVMFYSEQNAGSIDFSEYDYIVDAIDSVCSKVLIIKCAKDADVPVISSMGTGGKLSPEFLRIADISKTKYCPLARVMRRELKKVGIEKVKVVYSEEPPLDNAETASTQLKADRKPETASTQLKADRKPAPPSMIFVPAAAGVMIASVVVRDIIAKEGELF